VSKADGRLCLISGIVCRTPEECDKRPKCLPTTYVIQIAGVARPGKRPVIVDSNGNLWRLERDRDDANDMMDPIDRWSWRLVAAPDFRK
jgi:hypothetical protein